MYQDRTIIATAVPRITADFHSLGDISWYASAYLITSCATQLLWGRVYTFYSTKTVFLVSIVVFEIGSTICGAAPNSIAFIFGRAIAGTGSAGVFSGTTVILTHVVPLEKRPMYVGAMGSMFGISSIIGPLMGGAFTDRATWRWCFYIKYCNPYDAFKKKIVSPAMSADGCSSNSLPIGAVVLAVLVPMLHVRHEKDKDALSRQLIRLDPVGTLLFLPGVVCFLLALQWGGPVYPWDNGRIIALLVVAGVLVIAFSAVQLWRQEDATIPPRIMSQRSIAFGSLYAVFIGGGMISMLYSLPIWFQAVKGTSAVQSGIDTIPMVLSLVVGAMISGATITRTGYYVPWMFVSAILMSIGAGLMTTFTVDTGSPAWIGYQVLFGLGIGAGMQQPGLAAQTVLSKKDVSIGVALMFFSQSLGGAVFICVSQSVFSNHLADTLPSIPGIDPAAIIAAGATELNRVVPAESLRAVLVVYNDSLQKSFITVVAVAAALVLPAAGMEWRSIKKNKDNVAAD